MKRVSLAAGAAALAILCGGAHANAYITGTWIGYDFSQATAGQNFVYSDPLGIDLQPGQTWSRTFDYSVTLRNDGLPAGRAWEEHCVSTSLGACPPAADGREMAHISFGAEISKFGSGSFNFTVTGLPEFGDFYAAPGETVAYAGAFTVTETPAAVIFEPFSSLDSMTLWAGEWVDSSGVSPVPEAPGTSMLAGGLAFLALSGRRRAS